MAGSVEERGLVLAPLVISGELVGEVAVAVRGRRTVKMDYSCWVRGARRDGQIGMGWAGTQTWQPVSEIVIKFVPILNIRILYPSGMVVLHPDQKPIFSIRFKLCKEIIII